MSDKHLCPCTESCYLQQAMDSIGGKWKLPILCSLTANGASRYNDLLRNVNGISNTMLSKTLKELEESGLVRRAEYLEVPVRVEYEITERAKSLQPILLQLIQWEMEPRETDKH
ncbi:MAG: helix-turn-helix transcriptional regulator [Oscillospiraceae bacterium]|nr:helix-turn-helix transcriptional regulator [Oscillospiraceae bacterium]